MDVLLCAAGYGDPYLLGVVEQKQSALTEGAWDDVLEEMKQTFLNKPGQALRVAEKLEDRSQPEISAEEGTLEYWEQVCQNLARRFSKPAAAMDAILRMRKRGKDGVPSEVATILARVASATGDSQ
jgi:hypothetical protein